jgi:hypothetical protein
MKRNYEKLNREYKWLSDIMREYKHKSACNQIQECVFIVDMKTFNKIVHKIHPYALFLDVRLREMEISNFYVFACRLCFSSSSYLNKHNSVAIVPISEITKDDVDEDGGIKLKNEWKKHIIVKNVK